MNWKAHRPHVASQSSMNSSTLLILRVLLAALWHWPLICLVYGPAAIITDPKTLIYVPKFSLKLQTLCHGL